MSFERKKRIENIKKYAFMLDCKNCNCVSTYRFIDFEDSEKYRLKCSNCNHVGYIIYKKEFDEFYIEGNIGLTELTFISIEDMQLFREIITELEQENKGSE